MFRFLVFVFFCVLGVAGRSHRYDFSATEWMHISLLVGSPAQGPNNYRFSPTLMKNPKIEVTSSACGGYYSAHNSSTFRFGRNGPTKGSFSGWDSVTLDDVANTTVADVDLFAFCGKATSGHIGLGLGSGEKPSWMDGVLRRLGGSRSLVLAIRSVREFLVGGSIVLGDANPAICDGRWTEFAAFSAYAYQSLFNGSEVQIGKYHRAGALPLSFGDYISFDRETYAAAMKELVVGPSDRRIECDTATPIEFSAGPFKWTLQPEDYIRNFNGNCIFYPYLSNTFQPGLNMLPVKALNGLCLRYDFDAATVAFSKALEI